MKGRFGTIWLAATATAALASSPALVRGQDASPPSVVWSAPAECPAQSALQSEVDGLLGRPWTADDAIRVQAEVSQDGAGQWVLRLRAGDAAERVLPGESCEALTQAAALLVAWMIDPTSSGTEETALASEAPPETPEPLAIAHPGRQLAAPAVPAAIGVQPAAAAVDPAPVALARPAASALGAPDDVLEVAPRRGGAPFSIGLGAAFVLDVGTLPSVAPGFALEAVVRIERLDLRARGGWLAVQGASLANVMGAPSGAGVEIEYAGGSLAACARPLDGDDAGRPGFAVCGGVHVGAMLARGVRVSSPGQQDAWTAALGVGAVMPWAPVEWLDLEVGLELVIPLATPTFEIAPFGAVYTQLPVAGRLSLGGHVDVR